jgi:hypothetical protein
MPYLGAILFCNRLLPGKYEVVILTECDLQIMTLLLYCYLIAGSGRLNIPVILRLQLVNPGVTSR